MSIAFIFEERADWSSEEAGGGAAAGLSAPNAASGSGEWSPGTY